MKTLRQFHDAAVGEGHVVDPTRTADGQVVVIEGRNCLSAGPVEIDGASGDRVGVTSGVKSAAIPIVPLFASVRAPTLLLVRLL